MGISLPLAKLCQYPRGGVGMPRLPQVFARLLLDMPSEPATRIAGYVQMRSCRICLVSFMAAPLKGSPTCRSSKQKLPSATTTLDPLKPDHYTGIDALPRTRQPGARPLRC